jgi:hypothetical protein
MEDFCILDDFPAECPISDAELDAVEAFLMPALTRILDSEIAPEFPKETAFDSEPPQSFAR